MSGYTEQLNQQQKQAVEHEKGPLLIVAGAGTGKTTVITERIGHLITKKNVKPDQILALTFTEKAAAEMEERVDRLLPYGYVDLWISTFHAFAEKILHLHALDIGVPNDFKLLNDTQQWMLVRQNFDMFDLDYYRPRGNPTKFIHALLTLFSRAKDDAINPQDYLDYVENLKLNSDSAEFIASIIDSKDAKDLSKKQQKELAAEEIKRQAEIANAFHCYQQLLLEHNALDFGDLINYTLQLFEKRPRILNKYQQLFKHILVDEFQDTNHAQYELIKMLAAPNNNITVVGDDDQSIYKFRGASVSNILEFKNDYKNLTEIVLTKNYRSLQPILDLSYKFITQNNPDRLEVKLKNSKTNLSKKLVADFKSKGDIAHLHFKTGYDEIIGVLKKIDSLKKADPKASWDDFVILARTNGTANSFAQALELTAIPYRFMASKGLYLKPVVIDIIAYLRLLDNYHESTAVYRILNSPVIGLSYDELVKLGYMARRKGYSLFSTVKHALTDKDNSEEFRKKLEFFMGLLSNHSQLAAEKSVAEVVVSFINDSGYKKYLEEDFTLKRLQAAQYVNQFYKKIIQFEQSSVERSVKSFLEFVDLELEAGETGAINEDVTEGPESVKVMTVHAAKGLEFKYVFVVNLVDRKFPSDNRPDAIQLPESLIKEVLPEGDAHLQEERRLLYVAMTRAKEFLFFTSAEDYGGARKKKLSRFLLELENRGLKLASEMLDFEKDMLASAPVAKKEVVAGGSAVKHLIPKTFSYSQLQSFNNCPYHYWLEYVLKVPQKGKSIFSFGNSMHLTLQHFFTLVKERSSLGQASLFEDNDLSKEKLVTLDELYALYEKNWVDDWYISRSQHDQFKKEGKEILKKFYDDYLSGRPVPELLETPFKLHIRNDRNNEIYTMTGKIDRVDKTQTGIEIIDYKTGKPKTELDADGKRQLMIYKLAAREMSYQVSNLTYYYLSDGSKLTFESTSADEKRARDWIIKTIEGIKAFPFPADLAQCKCTNQDLKNL